MAHQTIQFRLCFKPLDYETLEDFLMTQQEELELSDREGAKRIIDLSFEKGGVIGGFDHLGQMQAMFGFFFGDPSEGYADKQLMYVYVAAISKPYRLSRTFLKGMAAILQEATCLNIDQFRMHALVSDPYINRLYSKFSSPLGESKYLRGRYMTAYGGSVDDVFSKIGPNLQSMLEDS